MSTMPRPKLSPSLLNKPKPTTRFHIDYDWWEQSKLDLKTYLFARLPASEESASIDTGMELVDLIDMATGEVRRVDGFQYLVQTYFRQLPDDFIKRASLVDAVFCVLLANGNHPLTAEEIAQRVERPTETILRTFGGATVYQGIRPIPDDE